MDSASEGDDSDTVAGFFPRNTPTSRQDVTNEYRGDLRWTRFSGKRTENVNHSPIPEDEFIGELSDDNISHIHSTNQTEPFVEAFPGAAKVFGVGEHLFRSIKPQPNPFFPFQTESEWELARWLMTSGLKASSINDFLHLDYVCFRFPLEIAHHLIFVLGATEPALFYNVPLSANLDREPPSASSLAIRRSRYRWRTDE